MDTKGYFSWNGPYQLVLHVQCKQFVARNLAHSYMQELLCGDINTYLMVDVEICCYASLLRVI